MALDTKCWKSLLTESSIFPAHRTVLNQLKPSSIGCYNIWNKMVLIFNLKSPVLFKRPVRLRQGTLAQRLDRSNINKQ